MSASSKPHPGGSNSIGFSGAVFIKSEDIVGSCLLAANPTQAVLTVLLLVGLFFLSLKI